MSSMILYVTFYVAPSKERNPRVSQLLRSLRAGHIGGGCTITKEDGFLTGRFELCDEDPLFTDKKIWRNGEYPDYTKEERDTRDLYLQVGAAGYLSEDHRITALGNGDDGDCPEEKQWRNRERLKRFWKEYPNLMGLMKYGHQSYDQPQP